METGFSSDIAWISVGDPIKIDKSCIYPVARVLALKGCGCILGCLISPEALLIVEPARAYAVSLTGHEITMGQLLAMAPSIKEIVEKETGKNEEDNSEEEK
ncbi:MAG: hypothetical protein ABR985_15670 [Methanotrichaceae archaeon]|jgi:uncharacterized spore protein YtfJ